MERPEARAQSPAHGAAGPVAPTPAALSPLRPLPHDAARLTAGWLHDWQRVTLTATLPHVLDRVEQGEARSNLARLAGESDAPLTGMFFTDTDVYKAVEAVAWASTRLPADHSLVQRAQALVDLVRRVQEPDGYVNSRVQGDPAVERWADPQWGHELYTAGHLLQAAVAAARTGSLPGALETARAMADLVVALFGPGGTGRPGYVEGHPEVETALVELYRLTGHGPYLDTAARQLELRGHGWLGEDRFGSAYFQDAVPVREAHEATGHAVRQLYLLTGVVDVAVETGDTELLAAAVRIWEDLDATKTYVTGAHGSRHRDEAIGDAYELPPDRAYAESCAAIATFHLAWRLLLATGEARYADAMDHVLHNALAASTSMSGTEFFYSNPLHLRTGHGGEHEDAPTQRLAWFTCACCPPNIARLLTSVHDYLLTSSPAGLQLQHHASADVDALVGTRGTPVHLEVTSDQPWGGTTRVVVTGGEDAQAWELAVRVPSWARDWSVTVDGAAVDDAAADGYVRLRRSWAGRHEVVLNIGVTVRQLTPHPRVDAVRGCVALARGPVVYALEQADLPAGVVLEDVRLRRVLGAVRAPEGAVAPVLLEAEVSFERPQQDALYSSAPRTHETEVAVVPLVPYHRWANRSPGPMRVWLPLADAPTG
ncbi:glycoside hydrolase family 127 protein [Streptomyces sp. NP160]|nr:glycoside hydrolase family 127 protein [Streptomyces sp. NP160]